MSITPLPTAPAVTDTTSEFNTKAFNWVAALDTFTTETNAIAEQVSDDAAAAATAQDAKDAAVAAANFKGAWSSLSGALNIPASVSHNGAVWMLLYNLANVASVEPGSAVSPQAWLNLSLPDQTGNADKFLKTNGSALSWEIASPSTKAIASGSIADGATVVVNSDGTVSSVGSVTPSTGSEAQFSGSSVASSVAAYDSINEKVVIAYLFNDGSIVYTLKAVVGTVSGTSISFGTPVTISTNLVQSVGIGFDSTSGKFVISYSNTGSNNGVAVVGTVSGTSISFGSPVIFSSGALYTAAPISVVYDSYNNKTVVFYVDDSLKQLKANVGTVSGTSISFGSQTTAINITGRFNSATFNPSINKIVAFYGTTGSGTQKGKCVVGTVSGTSITYGTAVDFFTSNTAENISSTYDKINKFVVFTYKGTSNYGYVNTAIVSGTVPSFGGDTIYSSENTEDNQISYNSILRKSIVAYRNKTSSNGQIKSIDFFTQSPTVSSAVTFYSSSLSTPNCLYDEKSGLDVILWTGAATGRGVVFDARTTNLNFENYIGFSSGSYTNGQTATIQTIGAIDDAQLSLKAGRSYYIQNNGSLSLTQSTPSVFAGTAISSNKIIVKG